MNQNTIRCILTVTLLSVTSLFLQGCSKNEGSKQDSPKGLSESNPRPAGSSLSLTNTLRDNFFWGECDDLWAEFREEAAKALDEHESIVEQYYASKPEKAPEGMVQIGKYSIIPASDPKPEEIGTYEFGWPLVVPYLAKARKENTPEAWAAFSKEAKDVLEYDEDRLVNEINFGLQYDSEPSLFQLNYDLTKCTIHNWDTCLSQQSTDFVKSVPNFRDLWAWMKRADTEEKKTDRLKFFTREIQLDWDSKFNLRKRTNVQRQGDTFIVPFRTTDYADAKDEIKKIIESYWRLGNQKVIVEWTDDPNAFELVGPKHYVRAETFYKTSKVLISSGAKIETFAHEFGHVLGFRDQYFDVWNEKECTYTEYSFGGNLMSRSQGGRVLQKHFDRLKAFYK